MPSVTPPRFCIECIRILFCLLIKIVISVHFGVEQVANRVTVQPVGKTAKRLVKRVRVPVLRLFEQPPMRTIQFACIADSLASGWEHTEMLSLMNP